MTEQIAVSLVVVTWNSSATIAAFLDSTTEIQGRHEVLIIDNASSDPTVEIAENHPSQPTVIANRDNRGLAAANNQGMLAARGSFFLICNPDIVLHPGTVEALLECAERRPQAAFILAKLLHPDGSLQPGVGDLPRLREALWGRASAKGRRSETGMWWDGWSHAEERQIGHGNEACYLVRRAAAAQIGPQDERYPLDWEGFDWSARAADIGWQVWFCPQAEATHVGGVSIRQAPRTRWVVSTHRGMYHYFADRGSPAARPLIGGLVTARMLTKLVALVLRPDLYRRAHRGRE